jgi:hypothetical protein
VRGVDKGIGSSLARRLLMLDARHMGWSEMRIVGLIKAPLPARFGGFAGSSKSAVF